MPLIIRLIFKECIFLTRVKILPSMAGLLTSVFHPMPQDQWTGQIVSDPGYLLIFQKKEVKTICTFYQYLKVTP